MTTLMSTTQITTTINGNNKEKLHNAVASCVYYAHKDGNITPILKLFGQVKSLANGQKMLAYLRDNAPVKYDKKAKSIVLDRDARNSNFNENDLDELPPLFAKKVKEVKFVVSNFKAKINKLDLASKEEITAELAAVQAYLKEVEGMFTDMI